MRDDSFERATMLEAAPGALGTTVTIARGAAASESDPAAGPKHEFMNATLLRHGAALLLAFTLIGASTPVSAYEEPKYTVEGTHEGFELRRYAPQLVVETTTRGDFDAARNEAFRRLFRYISGANRSQAKISMTVPVTTAGSGEKIAMTIPVTSAGTPGGGTVMQFVVPSSYTRDTVPQPTDPNLSIREIGTRLIAARHYSGRSTAANYERELGELRGLLPAAGLVEIGEPTFAVYNGPFTPWFLRRNEVLVEVRTSTPEPARR
jgi:hypothetical protein